MCHVAREQNIGEGEYKGLNEEAETIISVRLMAILIIWSFDIL